MSDVDNSGGSVGGSGDAAIAESAKAHESLRRRAGFKKHLHQDWPGRKRTRSLELVMADDNGWMGAVSRKIPDLRDDVRDVYLRWAITINAMHVARDRYVSHPERGLETRTIRSNKEGRGGFVVLESWTATDTARNYQLALPILASYALSDLYGLLEELVFELYLLYLADEPLTILKGKEFLSHRQAYRQRDDSVEAQHRWQALWSARLNTWQRNKTYDGLHKVFLAFMQNTQMKAPSLYTHTEVSDWALTIEAIGEARNLVTHGVGTVSDRLSTLSSQLKNDVFIFQAGDPLDITIAHLAFVEFFIDGLLDALTISVFERRFGNFPEPKPE